MSFPRTAHTNLSSLEITDRIAIRELLDACAHCADRRDGLSPLFEDLKAYEATTHFNAQSTVMCGQNSVSGVLNCLAHLVKVDGTSHTLTIVSVLYLDHFVKLDGHWRFKQRKAMQDWIDSRPLSAG